jgi:hypothetical protein
MNDSDKLNWILGILAASFAVQCLFMAVAATLALKVNKARKAASAMAFRFSRPAAETGQTGGEPAKPTA